MFDLTELKEWAGVLSGGGFALLAWYLIAKVIPKQTDDYRADIKALHTECKEERTELLKKLGVIE